MNYIVFDLEFNQDLSLLPSSNLKLSKDPFEIIQIGAVKLDSNYKTVATFNRYVKPTIYSQISSFVTDLTGITTKQLMSEEAFPKVFNEYMEFIGEEAAVFCIWGMSDIKVLFNNVEYHKLDKTNLPLSYINLQPYVSRHLDLSEKILVSLQTAVEALGILMPFKFHDALYDAYYTSEIFKIINTPALLAKRYDPTYVNIRPRQAKKVVDFEKLLLQFEKIYARELSKEEQDMVMLAYKMGKTNQFIKCNCSEPSKFDEI